MTWADSSFIVALYVESSQSRLAHGYLASNPQPMALTAFSRAEACHALRLCAFRGEISEGELVQYLHIFDRDQSEGYFQAVELDMEGLFQDATQLSHRYARSHGTRFLDVLHVAAAVQVKARRFLTFDKRQGKLAKSVGLDVRP